MKRKQLILKRMFDFTFALLGLIITFPFIILAIIIASIDTKSFGLFMQKRVGQRNKEFTIFKIKTMRKIKGINTFITKSDDKRITVTGRILRRLKIDELPQLINVLFGVMSFVGPRPDVKEMFTDLTEEEKQVLMLKPGITGPATLKYKNEEMLLMNSDDVESYNKLIFKDKIRINLEYMKHYKFSKDLYYIFKTIF